MDESELEAQALHDTRQRIRDERDRYRKALEEIAARWCVYLVPNDGPGGICGNGPAECEHRTARKALAEEEK